MTVEVPLDVPFADEILTMPESLIGYFNKLKMTSDIMVILLPGSKIAAIGLGFV